MKIPGGVPRRLVGVSIAHLLARAEEWAFDYLFYPYMLYSGGADLIRTMGAGSPSARTGFWTGMAVLVALSTAVNLLYLFMYDRAKRDWFGFEYLRSAKAVERFTARGMLRVPARMGAFMYLSVWHGPLFATLCLRSGPHKFKMTSRDWLIFGGAVIAANVGWTGLVTVSLSVFKMLMVLR